MEKYESLEEKINHMHESGVEAQAMRIHVPLLSLAAAALCFWSLAVIQAEALWYFMLFVAVVLFVCAVIAFVAFFRKRTMRYLYRPTRSPFRIAEIYLPLAEKNVLLEGLQKADYKVLQKCKKQQTSNMMLKIMCTKDRQMALLQLKEYVPYRFEAVSPVMVVTNAVDMKEITSFLEL